MPEPENPAHPEPVEGPKDLTHFTPVPRLKDRSNGWKPEVQRAFIEALADYGSVAAACRVVGRADHGAYLLRRHPEGAEFAAAWDKALDHGVLRLQDSLMERAIHGVPVPVYSYGKLIGERRVYNDRLGMFILRNRLPAEYCEGGARGLNALDRAKLERLKKEWLAEHLAAEREEEVAECMAFLQQIEATHRNWYANMSPAARAAYRMFRRIERETSGWQLELHEAEEREAAEAEYEDLRAEDPRAPIRRRMEAAGWFVDEVLADDDEAKAEEDRQTVARVRTIKDDGW